MESRTKESRTWTAQMMADVVRLVARLESVMNFQIATALQTTVQFSLSAPLQLCSVVQLCLLVHAAQRAWRTDARIARDVLAIQVGQTILRVLGGVQEWAGEGGVSIRLLFFTFALFFPTMLAIVNPALMANDYAQNAVSVYLFQYATMSRELVARVDFGTSPAIVSLLVMVISTPLHRVFAKQAALNLCANLFQAVHMLLVDLLLGSVTDTTGGMPQTTQIAALLMVVVVVDELSLGSVSVFKDVRGYTVFRIAGEVQRMQALSMDASSSLAVCLHVFCVRNVLRILRVSSRVADSVSEIVLVVCINVLIQSFTGGAHTTDLNPELRFLRVSFFCIVSYTTVRLLQER